MDNGAAPALTESMIEGGVDLIQLRGKERSINELTNIAATLHEITSRSSTPLIVNDHTEIAVEVPVEAVRHRTELRQVQVRVARDQRIEGPARHVDVPTAATAGREGDVPPVGRPVDVVEVAGTGTLGRGSPTGDGALGQCGVGVSSSGQIAPLP